MNRNAPADPAIHPLLAARWSPRTFAAQPVAVEVQTRLLEAARWAPSSYNEQPWAFLVADSSDPIEYARLLSCLIEFNQGWAKSAPLLMLTLAHRVFGNNGKPNAHAWHDVGLAVAHLTLQATAEGLLVHQMAGILPEQIRELYQLPVDWEPVSALALGYPGDPQNLPEPLRERELAPRTRKSRQTFVFRGRFGSE